MPLQITPFIWFDADPHEVRDYYAGIFDDFETVSELRGPEDDVIGFTVSIDGQQFSLFNGGSGQPHSNAMSLMIYTDDQEQTDRYWDALTADGGEELPCGWLKDKYGVRWQVTPKLMIELLAGDDAERRKLGFEAMLTMHKLIVADIEAAADGNA